ncbi:MAG: SBBP repeat-containing protein [Phycisphaerales bacterium]
MLWHRQADMRNRAIALDSHGNIYTGGSTSSGLYADKPFERSDAVVIKYGPQGDELWGRQFGDTYFYDSVNSIALDGSDNVYVGGYTMGDSYNVRDDAYLMKYDPSGVKLWYKQIDSNAGDSGNDVVIDHDGNAYLSGTTYGDLAGINENHNYKDTYLIKHDTAGDRLWAKQYGTPIWEEGVIFQ